MNETLSARPRAAPSTPAGDLSALPALLGAALATLGTAHLLAALTGRGAQTFASGLALLGLGLLAVYIGYKKAGTAGAPRPLGPRRVRALARAPQRRPRFVRMAHETPSAE